MTKASKYNLLPLFVSIILGGACLYAYTCFQGVVSVWLIDIGYYKVLSKFICALFDPGSSRTFSFQIINFLKNILVQIILCTLFLYWFLQLFRGRLIISCFSLLLGALITDLFFYFQYSNELFTSILSYTIFFDKIILNYLFNIILWGLVFALSIILADFVRSSQGQK